MLTADTAPIGSGRAIARVASSRVSAAAPADPVWTGDAGGVCFAGDGLRSACRAIRQPAYLVRSASGAVGVALGGGVGAPARGEVAYPLVGVSPPIYPEWLGDRSFCEQHGVRFPYIVGEMAHGIASPRMVVATGEAGLLGFLGTAGLSPSRIEDMSRAVAEALDPQGLPWGANLIHSPHDNHLEWSVAELYLRLGVARVSASAFMSITPALVLLAAKGLSVAEDGTVVRPRHIFAKISRPETARLFMSPPPDGVLRSLVGDGHLTEREADLASQLAIAEDVTVEADSGGHTDNRPMTVSLPRVAELRAELTETFGYQRRIRVGAGGGVGSPAAAAAAFGLGADFVLTGSINQACVESGLSESARELLVGIDMADVAMAASADMFELGVKVQVLKRGVMFAARANQLYALYSQYGSLEDLPHGKRAQLEKDVFRAPIDEIWTETRNFFRTRNPAEVERAERDPKHRMALVFRWYLGNSIRWAINGDADRKVDYQIWCGPAMGAFNSWTAGTWLENVEARTVGQVGKNLLEGSAVILRAQALRAAGVAVGPECFRFEPELLA
ncbi:MAG: PfaD family polyunsaturated fatty acid/polyketide biosynthesis protein [Pseudomonadota bacterium]